MLKAWVFRDWSILAYKNKSETFYIWGSWLSIISIIRIGLFVSSVYLDQTLLHKRDSTFSIFVKCALTVEWNPNTKQFAQDLAHRDAEVALRAGGRDARWADDLIDFIAKAQTDSVSLTKPRMREKPNRATLASLPFSHFFDAQCTGARQKKSDRSVSIHRGCSPDMASPSLSIFASISLREWDTYEHVVCFPRNCQLACQSSVLQNHQRWENTVVVLLSLPLPTEPQEQHRFPSYPPCPSVTHPHSSPGPCWGRLASQLPFYLLVKELERLKTVSQTSLQLYSWIQSNFHQ